MCVFALPCRVQDICDWLLAALCLGAGAYGMFCVLPKVFGGVQATALQPSAARGAVPPDGTSAGCPPFRPTIDSYGQFVRPARPRGEAPPGRFLALTCVALLASAVARGSAMAVAVMSRRCRAGAMACRLERVKVESRCGLFDKSSDNNESSDSTALDWLTTQPSEVNKLLDSETV